MLLFTFLLFSHSYIASSVKLTCFCLLSILQPQDRQQVRSEKGGKPLSTLDTTDVSYLLVLYAAHSMLLSDYISASSGTELYG